VLVAGGENLDAETVLNACIQRYERSISESKFRRTATFGKAYALLADIYYFNRQDFKGALARYQAAERNGYWTPDTDYRSGYIYYIDKAGEDEKALSMFYRAGLDREQSPYLLFAIANTLYRRSDWFAAQGYYAMLAQRLQFELDTISLPSPQLRPSHEELVDLLMQARNNLGAALFHIGERLGDGRKRSDAMVSFTESARLFDSLVRDQTTMARSQTRNLAYLNVDAILHPKRGEAIMIYIDIRPDMKFPKDSTQSPE
jgi:tetratricopeptide (TPR) repeat protein